MTSLLGRECQCTQSDGAILRLAVRESVAKMVSWRQMTVFINGQERQFPELHEAATLGRLLAALELQSDRVAVELNGSIVGRAEWENAPVQSGDKLEIVHFVGGGCD